jgi:hypothetical protein
MLRRDPMSVYSTLPESRRYQPYGYPAPGRGDRGLYIANRVSSSSSSSSSSAAAAA